MRRWLRGSLNDAQRRGLMARSTATSLFCVRADGTSLAAAALSCGIKRSHSVGKVSGEDESGEKVRDQVQSDVGSRAANVDETKRTADRLAEAAELKKTLVPLAIGPEVELADLVDPKKFVYVDNLQHLHEHGKKGVRFYFAHHRRNL